METKPNIQDTPAALVESGDIHTGFFRHPFRRVNLLGAHCLGGRWGRALRFLRLKEWVGFGFDHPRLYGAMIIQNARYAASGTVYMYQKDNGQFSEWLTLDLPHRGTLPEALWRGVSRCGLGGRRMRFEHELDEGRHRVWVRMKASRNVPSIAADLLLHQDWTKIDPLVVSLPIGKQHHTYTHKSPLYMEGEIRIGDSSYVLDPSRDMGSLDEQKTFYPYHSGWKWGCFAGRSKLREPDDPAGSTR